VTIASLQRRLPPVESDAQFDPAITASLPARLRSNQRLFEETGGLHGAGLFATDGTAIAFAEDVGRHNAVDKVVGRMLIEERLPLGDAALAVSGRTSFEIVQKAWTAGVAMVCAVSAPSSLAVDLAAAAGITLLGFARDGGFNIYSHPSRIREV
jgi:FdhD protein